MSYSQRPDGRSLRPAAVGKHGTQPEALWNAPRTTGDQPRQRHGTNRLVRVDESCDVTGPVVEWLSGGARRAGSTGVMDADLANGGPGRPERYSRTGDRVCMDQTAIDRDRVGERADGLPVSAEAAHIAGAKGDRKSTR